MIRKINFIFCDNEHGTGDVMFPDLKRADFIQEAISLDGFSAANVRRFAKKNGWGQVNGGDYCPDCMASM